MFYYIRKSGSCQYQTKHAQKNKIERQLLKTY